MLLAPEDAKLFFKLHQCLSCYVNQRLGIVPNVDTPLQFGTLAPEARFKVRAGLLQHLELIDRFVAENPFDFSHEELEIVHSWRRLVAGKFYIFRYLSRYTVFLSSGNEPIAYGVVALTQTFEELAGPDLPRLTETVLLPFRDKIVYEGLLTGPNVALSFGPGIRRRLNDSYKEAKARLGIVTALPAPSEVAGEGPTQSPPKPRTPTKQATRAQDAAPVLQCIVAMTDQFCRERLNDEYAELCRELAGKLARKRPSPLLQGHPETWACGIVRTIGYVNFLDDRTQSPHLKFTDIDAGFSVSQSTGQARSAAIRKTLRIDRFNPQWTLPSRIDDNPMVWLLEVDGFTLDIRDCPRELQEQAFRKGLIPYIPADRQGSSAV